LGLIAKELYWDFKTALEEIVTEPMIKNYLSEASEMAHGEKIIQDLKIGYK